MRALLGLAMVAATCAGAQAQDRPRMGDFRDAYVVASDVGGPYAAMPPLESRAMLMPAIEVYAVLRDNGFSPLGIPRQRGLVYVIAALDQNGDDGRLVIDARNGRIVRFIPAGRVGEINEDIALPPFPSRLPPMVEDRRMQRPPMPVPRVASRTPTAAPARAAAAQPLPAPQQSAAVQPKPDATPTPAPVEAKPAAPPIGATQPMPPAQGLD